MKVLIIDPLSRPRLADIDPGLESLQSLVGGYIEAIYPFDDNVGLICNEEGKLIGLPSNRALRDDDGNIYDVVCGTFLVVGLTEDDFTDLTDEQVERYALRFQHWELYPDHLDHDWRLVR